MSGCRTLRARRVRIFTIQNLHSEGDSEAKEARDLKQRPSEDLTTRFKEELAREALRFRTP